MSSPEELAKHLKNHTVNFHWLGYRGHTGGQKGHAVNQPWGTQLRGRPHPCVMLGFAPRSHWHYSVPQMPSSLITETLRFPCFLGGKGEGLPSERFVCWQGTQNWSCFSLPEKRFMNLLWVRVCACCAYNDFSQHEFLQVLTASWFPRLQLKTTDTILSIYFLDYPLLKINLFCWWEQSH